MIAALAAAGLASAGVLLLYGRPIGIGLALFLAATAGVATLTNRVRIPWIGIPLGLVAFLLALLPSVEETGVLATLLALAALGLYTIAITGYLAMGRVALGDALVHLGLGAFTVPSQIHALVERLSRAAPISGRALAGCQPEGSPSRSVSSVQPESVSLLETGQGFDRIALCIEPDLVDLFGRVALAAIVTDVDQKRKIRRKLRISGPGYTKALLADWA